MTDQEVLARTIWGEARGEGVVGMLAIACVIQNRVKNPRWWGHDWQSVCLAREQFSCWLPGKDHDAMVTVTEDDDAYAQAMRTASAAIIGLEDLTSGADSYANMVECTPSWAATATQTCVIGRHTFFRVELPAPV